MIVISAHSSWKRVTRFVLCQTCHRITPFRLPYQSSLTTTHTKTPHRMLIALKDCTIVIRFAVTDTLIIFLHGVDSFLNQLKCRKEYRVYSSGAPHGHAEPAIHVSPEELDFRNWDLLAFRVHQCVSLVDTFDRINGI